MVSYAQIVIAAIVLAAGASERMEAAKLALPYGESTLLGSVVEAALASHVDQTVVVTGFHAAVIEPLLPHAVLVVRNPSPQRGNLSSLQTGVQAVGEAEGIVLLLGDQPEVPAEAIDRLVDRFERDRPWAIVSEYSGIVSHPFLLSARCVASTGELSGPRPLWRHLVTAPPLPVARVAQEGAVPLDVDTGDDYRELLERS